MPVRHLDEFRPASSIYRRDEGGGGMRHEVLKPNAMPTPEENIHLDPLALPVP